MDDVWELVQMHLKPRHLMRLMNVNRNINSILANNEQYWARIALHMMWRNAFQLYPYPLDDMSYTGQVAKYYQILRDGFDRQTLYFFINLTIPYRDAMDYFVRLTAPYGSPAQCVNHMIVMKICEGCEFVGCVGGSYSEDEIGALSMREVCRREVQALKYNSFTKRILRWVQYVDDLRISVRLKRELALKTTRMFMMRKNAGLWAHEEALNYMVMLRSSLDLARNPRYAPVHFYGRKLVLYWGYLDHLPVERRVRDELIDTVIDTFSVPPEWLRTRSPELKNLFMACMLLPNTLKPLRL